MRNLILAVVGFLSLSFAYAENSWPDFEEKEEIVDNSRPALNRTKNVFNFGTVPAGLDEKLKTSLDKPYKEFVKDWMKDPALRGLTRLLGADWGQFEITRTFWARDDAEFQKMAKNAVATFKAYCLHHQGEPLIARNEAFCIKDRQAFTYMTWLFTDTANSYDRKVDFLHDVDYRADRIFKSKILAVQPGNVINTKKGRALVVERGDNFMIKVQTNNKERWITTEDILVDY